jgi:glutathione S-transferase
MFKLYYAPGTCARASHIALEEAGASYAAERLDFKNSQQTTPQYLAINPKGRVPALVTDRGTPDRNAGDPRLHRAELPAGQADARRHVRVRTGAVL